MKILVTGGAGFIGSNFILYWLQKYKSDSIVNLDLLTYAGNLQNLKSLKNNPRYSFVRGDICDNRVVEKILQKGVGVIVHFAAESHVDRSITGPAQFIQTNIVGTHVLLRGALRHRVKRFHHISTDEVYGSLSLRDKKKFNELSCYNPSSPYSASKASSDFLVSAYFKTFGLPITISTTSNNYGPRQHEEKFIPVVIKNALQGKHIPVYGDGLYVRDWIYVEDNCRGIDLVLKRGKLGETYCIGANTEMSNLDVIRKILKILRKDKSLVTPVTDRLGHDRRYAIDAGKIWRLGFRPQFAFDEGIANTIEWYKQHFAT